MLSQVQFDCLNFSFAVVDLLRDLDGSVGDVLMDECDKSPSPPVAPIGPVR